MPESLLLKNCKIYNLEGEELYNIGIKGKSIASITKAGGTDEKGMYDSEVDLAGNTLIPGLIEVHIQGAGGADILDNNLDSLKTIANALASTGVTGYLGTTVVKPNEGNAHLKLAASYTNKDLGGATLLGIHLEGPYINPQKKGGLDPAGIFSAAEMPVEEILEATQGTLKMMTIAPELEGALDVIKILNKNGCIPAFAHSNATYEEAKKGFEAGIDHVTHIFNAMPSISHRTPGPLGAIFENPTITVQIISDGHHLHPAIVNMIYKIIGPDRCICITDGMHGIGLPEGTYIYNGREYISKDGAARYLDGTLIGSTMSLTKIALKFMEFTGCTFVEAINTVTVNPARLLGIDNRKGSIEIGKDADLVVLDPGNSVSITIVEGKIVYRR